MSSRGRAPVPVGAGLLPKGVGRVKGPTANRESSRACRRQLKSTLTAEEKQIQELARRGRVTRKRMAGREKSTLSIGTVGETPERPKREKGGGRLLAEIGHRVTPRVVRTCCWNNT